MECFSKVKLSSFVPKNGKVANRFTIPFISESPFFATPFPNAFFK